MDRNALLLVRAAAVFTFCVALGISAPATAQQATLEVQGRQGDYYWVVETAVDGSRKGGWVSAQVPLDGIDRNALRPIPPTGPVQAAPPPVAVPDTPAAPAAQTQPTTATRAPVAQPSPGSGAKPPLARRGFWFSGGLGAGIGDCDTCLRSETGPSGGLSLGGSVGNHVLLGVGTAGWAKYLPDDDVTISGGILDFRVRVYPVASSGFFLTGGLGVGGITATQRVDFSAGRGFAGVTYTETGAGALFGIGWDLRVGRNVSVTPFYNGFAVSTETTNGSVAQFGLGITIH